MCYIYKPGKKRNKPTYHVCVTFISLVKRKISLLIMSYIYKPGKKKNKPTYHVLHL